MARTKISTLNLRIEPGVKSAIRVAAEREHRSIANMVEMLIRRHCDREGISVPEPRGAGPRTDRSAVPGHEEP
ncbi:MAG: hypothetical protein R3176_01750 [Woeseiaceae bacterium]|nr:hypothetical protein [Woeseiaceae bacterium]